MRIDNNEALLDRCIRKDFMAWSEFIEQFSGILYYSARERLKRSGISFNSQDIEDIVQGIFVELWEKEGLIQVRERKKITAWLSIVAQTRALNYIRKRKERLIDEDSSYIVDNLVAERDETSYNSNANEDLIQGLEKAIKGLPARERLILKLNIIYEKKHREIANFMKLPINTVSSIIARKKKELKERLKIFERK